MYVCIIIVFLTISYPVFACISLKWEEKLAPTLEESSFPQLLSIWTRLRDMVVSKNKHYKPNLMKVYLCVCGCLHPRCVYTFFSSEVLCARWCSPDMPNKECKHNSSVCIHACCLPILHRTAQGQDVIVVDAELLQRDPEASYGQRVCERDSFRRK